MNLNEIKQLIKIFERSKIGELEIVEDNHKIKMRRNNQQTPASSNANGGTPAYIVPPTANVQGQAPVQQSEASNETAAENNQNYFEVRAPMVGTFYRAPAPDADAYVENGHTIKAGQTLCIIEAMKLMNEIQSEVDGKIAKILVENAQPVEYNQVLFLVEK